MSMMIMKDLDEDRDGKVSKAELKQYLQVQGDPSFLHTRRQRGQDMSWAPALYDKEDSFRILHAATKSNSQEPLNVKIRRAARARDGPSAFSPERNIGAPPKGDIHVGPGVTYGHGWWTGKVVRRSPSPRRRARSPRKGMRSPQRGVSPGRMSLSTGTDARSMATSANLTSMNADAAPNFAGDIEFGTSILNGPVESFWAPHPRREREQQDPFHGMGLPTTDWNPQPRQPTPATTEKSERPSVPSEPSGPRVATPNAPFVISNGDIIPAAFLNMQEGDTLMKGEEKELRDDEGHLTGTTELVIDYDAAIFTYDEGVAQAAKVRATPKAAV